MSDKDTDAAADAFRAFLEAVKADLARGEGSPLALRAVAKTRKALGCDGASPLATFLAKRPFGCKSDAAVELVAALTEDPGLPAAVAAAGGRSGACLIPPGCVVVPTANTNDHDYDLGVPVLTWGDQRGVRADGTTGNNLPIRYGQTAPATPAQAAAAIAAAVESNPALAFQGVAALYA